ncbi:MAG: LemA family protein [Comamonadaceae bacterium]|nr:LemA family protein [Comamonadaceae bacterium]
MVNNPEAFDKFQAGAGRAVRARCRACWWWSENYPNLKANQGFQDLRVQLEGTENRITVARNRYIKAVQDYNVLARQFPTNLTAMVFGYEVKPNFTVRERGRRSRRRRRSSFGKPTPQPRGAGVASDAAHAPCWRAARLAALLVRGAALLAARRLAPWRAWAQDVLPVPAAGGARDRPAPARSTPAQRQALEAQARRASRPGRAADRGAAGAEHAARGHRRLRAARGRQLEDRPPRASATACSLVVAKDDRRAAHRGGQGARGRGARPRRAPDHRRARSRPALPRRRLSPAASSAGAGPDLIAPHRGRGAARAGRGAAPVDRRPAGLDADLRCSSSSRVPIVGGCAHGAVRRARFGSLLTARRRPAVARGLRWDGRSALALGRRCCWWLFGFVARARRRAGAAAAAVAAAVGGGWGGGWGGGGWRRRWRRLVVGRRRRLRRRRRLGRAGRWDSMRDRLARILQAPLDWTRRDAARALDGAALRDRAAAWPPASGGTAARSASRRRGRPAAVATCGAALTRARARGRRCSASCACGTPSTTTAC